MNVWANTVITNKGYALLAKLTQGHTLDLVEAITGAGYVTPGLLQNQTAVTDPKQSLVFRQVSYPENGKCVLPVYLTNGGLAAGYEATQLGVFANDPDEGKILFFIAQSVEATKGTTIPSEAEMPGYSAEWNFHLQYGQADGVNVNVDPANTVSRSEMEQYVTANAISRSEMEQHVAANAISRSEMKQHVAANTLKLGRVAAQLPNDIWHTLTYGGGKFVAVTSRGTAAVSEDGINWTEVTMPNYEWRSVTYGGGKFVAVSYDFEAAVSEDGINWTEVTMHADRWRSVTYGGGKFVAVSDFYEVAVSEDGINWTRGNSLRVWKSVTYGGGKFVAVGSSDKAAVSVDGINWTEFTMPDDYWYKVIYGGGKFVAMGDYGKVAFSENGIDWTEVTIPYDNPYDMRLEGWNLTYGGGKFVAVTDLLYFYGAAVSEDCINWTRVTMPYYDWTHVNYGGGKFVAVTDRGKVAVSEDGINWIYDWDAIEQDGEDVSEGVRKAIGAATEEDVKKAVTVTSDVRLHLSVTADGILQVTVLDDEGG